MRGVAMVETAISFTLFVVLTFAIIQFALIQNAIVTVQYYAKEGARYGAVHFGEPGWSATTSVQNYLQTEVAQTSGMIPYSSLTVTVYPPPATTGTGTSTVTALPNGVTPPPTTLTVEVTYDLANKVLLSPVVPGVSAFKTNYTYYATSCVEGM